MFLIFLLFLSVSILEFLSISHLRDEQAKNLSGGQKKLLELGRTMMTDAKLVLLDEPGAGVNPTLLLNIREMIARLREERGPRRGRRGTDQN